MPFNRRQFLSDSLKALGAVALGAIAARAAFGDDIPETLVHPVDREQWSEDWQRGIIHVTPRPVSWFKERFG